VKAARTKASFLPFLRHLCIKGFCPLLRSITAHLFFSARDPIAWFFCSETKQAFYGMLFTAIDANETRAASRVDDHNTPTKTLHPLVYKGFKVFKKSSKKQENSDP